jgi:hypothetical protein
MVKDVQTSCPHLVKGGLQVRSLGSASPDMVRMSLQRPVTRLDCMAYHIHILIGSANRLE